MPIKLTTEQFIKNVKKVHGNKYDYSKVEYVNAVVGVEIICPIHGSFLQIPNNHQQGNSCPKCGMDRTTNSKRKTIKEFIKIAKKIHGNKYNYSKVIYEDMHDKIEITCPKHGVFLQRATNHKTGRGCPKCGANKSINARRKTIEIFMKRVKKVHGNKYDYSKVVYEKARNKVEITCPKHGVFLQTPSKHLNGKQGCPSCSSSQGENKIKRFLERNKIKFEQQKRFSKCKSKKTLPFDFYLPEHNVLIEYDGAQHSVKDSIYYSEDIIKRDIIKNNFAKDNSINLMRIKYTDYDKIDYRLQQII